jgi:hypothetical protein
VSVWMLDNPVSTLVGSHNFVRSYLMYNWVECEVYGLSSASNIMVEAHGDALGSRQRRFIQSGDC